MDDLLTIAADVFDVPIAELTTRHRANGRVVDARQAVALVLRRRAWTLKQIGAAFGRDHSTVIYMCEMATERARQPAFAAKLALLERGETWEAQARRLAVENAALRDEVARLKAEGET